jgi:hypothetical protein
MNMVSGMLIAAGVFLSLYGVVQLAFRPYFEAENKRAPFWKHLYEIIFRGSPPLESTPPIPGSPAGKAAKLGWRYLVLGFSLQFIGTILTPAVWLVSFLIEQLQALL